MLNKLKGYKTYITAFVAVALNFAVYMNWLTVDQLGQLNAVLGFLGLSFLRAGSKNDAASVTEESMV